VRGFAKLPCKLCIDCKFFPGSLTDEDKRFLEELLQPRKDKYGLPAEYSPTQVLGWLTLKNVRGPEQARAVKVLRDSLSYCEKTDVDVYALEPACYLWQPRREGKIEG
jgi:hypothetical protein